MILKLVGGPVLRTFYCLYPIIWKIPETVPVYHFKFKMIAILLIFTYNAYKIQAILSKFQMSKPFYIDFPGFPKALAGHFQLVKRSFPNKRILRINLCLPACKILLTL